MSPVLPLHLGSLHPVEQGLTIALAFGPFALLGLVVWLRRREDDRLDAEQDAEQDAERTEGAETAEGDGLSRASRPPPAPGP